LSIWWKNWLPVGVKLAGWPRVSFWPNPKEFGILCWEK
jgi:hypothetical protein